MNKPFLKAGLVIGLLVASGAALAERSPRPVPADARIRKVVFEKDNVVVLHGVMGISTMVMFGDDEKIATVAMGDSASWQAVPDASKRYLFIKPLERGAVTNMNVVTNRRVYNFILRGGPPSATNAVYKLAFSYPDEEADRQLLNRAKEMAAMPNLQALMSRPSVNLDYSFKGSVINKPDAAFDDGVKTYFRFPNEVPAIFVVKPDGSESLMNYRREGEVIVVDKRAGQWTLRKGDEVTCVFNMRAVEPSEKQTEATPIMAPPAPEPPSTREQPYVESRF